MVLGDIGGVETWRSLTMRSPATGDVAIAKGDAVTLSGNQVATNVTDAEDAVFGEAMAACTANGALLPVKVAGVSEFAFTGAAPVVDGAAGVVASATDGHVKKPASGNGCGRNVAVAISSMTLTLSTVTAGQEVVVNGVTFTAHGSTTTAANGEFAIGGDDTADAAALAGLINDPAYGVPGVTASADNGVVTLTVADAAVTKLDVTVPVTVTAAAIAGRVRVLL